MRFSQIFAGTDRPWLREIVLTAIALAIGFLLMPMLIFFVGSAALGRYEGASLGRLFKSIYGTLESGSLASWVVLLGPYALLLVFRGLKVWWRAGTGPA
jgi:ABC-type enterochelin transport system permease subunit